MKRKVKLFPTLILLTGGLLWAAALPAATSSHGPAKQVAKADAAAAESAPQAITRVSHVSIEQADAGQKTIIRVAADHEPLYHVFQLSNPSRLVVDLRGARNDSNQWKITADSPFVKEVRLGRFKPEDGGIIRVVADLTGNPAFDVQADPDGIQIQLSSRTAVAKSSPEKAVPSPAKTDEASITPAQPKPAATLKAVEASVQPAQLKPAANQPPKVEMVKAETVPPPAQAQYQSALPGTESPAVAAPKPEPVSHNPEAAKADSAAKVISTTSSAAAPAAIPAQDSGSEASGTPQYTGAPISVNLKNVDLKDFFRLIHELSGLNILVDPDVNGSVTMVLDSVPWDQALDIVLKDNGLGKVLEGNVLRIAKLSTLQSEQEEAKKLAAAKIDAEPLVTVFRPINYAKATALATMLKSWVGGGALSSRGSVLVDERTNTLIISDVRQQIPIIENVITKLDQKSAQISIEARIIRATTDFARTLQSALALATVNSTGHIVNSVATGQGVGATTATAATTTPVTAASASGFGVYFLSNQAGRYLINAALAAAETRDEAKVISRPSVVTQNNVQATVVQGTQIPVQTTINNTVSVQYVQASLQLEVTPQVTNDGNVFLTLRITNNSPGALLTTVAPSINTQSATTEVLVPDGGTVVFGGVTVTQRSKSSSQVPLLGSIPVLGHLFKNSQTTSNDQELLFFVTPKILKG